MNYIHQEMITMGADGVIFHGIGLSTEQILMNPIQEYTIEGIKSATIFPRCARSYYKIIDGKRVLYNYSKQMFINESVDNLKYKIVKEFNEGINKAEDMLFNGINSSADWIDFIQLNGRNNGLKFALDRIKEEENV